MATGVRIYQNMKKIITVLIFAFVAMCAYAQKDVTQFLGIPVDGSKSEMIQKLKAKGFRKSSIADLEGEFNGRKVLIGIVTNENKVWRIAVMDDDFVDETQIKIRFNTIFRQFENSPKYIHLFENSCTIPIPEDENLSLEMLLHKKRYEAVFHQKLQTSEKSINDKCMAELLTKYTSDQIGNPTDAIRDEIVELSKKYLMEEYGKRQVWFMIRDYYGKYYIIMFYDNKYNEANGEDL